MNHLMNEARKRRERATRNAIPGWPTSPYEACASCGDDARILVSVPDTVRGGVIIYGAEIQRCRTCDRNLFYYGRKS